MLRNLFKDRELLAILLMIAAVKSFIIIISLLAPVIPFGKGLQEGNFLYRIVPSSWLHHWEAFDGQWYLEIAEKGYHEKAVFGDTQDFGFFPGYPMLIRLLSYVLKDTTLSALIISYIASIVMVILLYRLIRLDNDVDTSKHAVLYLLLFPTAFFLSCCYSEALYMMFVIAAFLYGRKKEWVISSLFGFLTALTRKNGVIIFIPLLFLYLKQRDFNIRLIKIDILSLLLIPAAPLSFILYVSTFTHDIFSIFKEPGIAGEHRLCFPLVTIFSDLKNLSILGYRYGLLDRLLTLIFLAMLVPMWKVTKKEYWIYSFLAIVPPLCFGHKFSLMRYLLPSFPHFIYLALVTRTEASRYIIIVIFTAFLSIFTLLFVNWYWV